jgi:hypothetical protein
MKVLFFVASFLISSFIYYVMAGFDWRAVGFLAVFVVVGYLISRKLK